MDRLQLLQMLTERVYHVQSKLKNMNVSYGNISTWVSATDNTSIDKVGIFDRILIQVEFFCPHQLLSVAAERHGSLGKTMQTYADVLVLCSVLRFIGVLVSDATCDEMRVAHSQASEHS